MMTLNINKNIPAGNDNKERALNSLMTIGATLFSPPLLDDYYVFIGDQNVNGTVVSKRIISVLEKKGFIQNCGHNRYHMVCRQCKCSQFNACEPSCFWVEPGLCSSCSPQSELLIKE